MKLNDMICRDHIFEYDPCSLGSVLGNTALGTIFLDTLPRANIRNTSSGLGVQNPRAWESLGPRAMLLSAVYGYIIITRTELKTPNWLVFELILWRKSVPFAKLVKTENWWLLQDGFWKISMFAFCPRKNLLYKILFLPLPYVLGWKLLYSV